ncbi:hypothetical protein K470DRAFT_262094 [Piedraia hortae CBS 480.64]|uniref:Uncharacterized protein n=1 Tax=Piedraia hortae CBS 480.64 TaxID=1314780 RepID=A0A6A7C6X8_9PEZI|nr:hypothetical protein K470DRAFT_262094 [Piedraia hortae CBS 480.64]
MDTFTLRVEMQRMKQQLADLQSSHDPFLLHLRASRAELYNLENRYLTHKANSCSCNNQAIQEKLDRLEEFTKDGISGIANQLKKLNENMVQLQKSLDSLTMNLMTPAASEGIDENYFNNQAFDAACKDGPQPAAVSSHMGSSVGSGETMIQKQKMPASGSFNDGADTQADVMSELAALNQRMAALDHGLKQRRQEIQQHFLKSGAL